VLVRRKRLALQPGEVDYLDKVPLRDQTLVGVGGVLYLAASPDEFDGLSEKEFDALKTYGPAVFGVYEQLGKVGLPQNFQLPEGFANHFSKEVLSDVEIIRQDPAKREEFRREVRAVLANPSNVKNLYRGGGTTWSDIASQVAGTNRSGKFYSEDRRKPSERNSDARVGGEGIRTLEKVDETKKGEVSANKRVKVAISAVERHDLVAGKGNGRKGNRTSANAEVARGSGETVLQAGELVADTLVRLPKGHGLASGGRVTPMATESSVQRPSAGKKKRSKGKRVQGSGNRSNSPTGSNSNQRRNGNGVAGTDRRNKGVEPRSPRSAADKHRGIEQSEREFKRGLKKSMGYTLITDQ